MNRIAFALSILVAGLVGVAPGQIPDVSAEELAIAAGLEVVPVPFPAGEVLYFRMPEAFFFRQAEGGEFPGDVFDDGSLVDGSPVKLTKYGESFIVQYESARDRDFIEQEASLIKAAAGIEAVAKAVYMDFPGAMYFPDNVSLASGHIVVEGEKSVDMEELAAKYGLEVATEIEYMEGGYLLRMPDHDLGESITIAREIATKEVGVSLSNPIMLSPMETMSIPNDPFFSRQWHLRNTGQESDNWPIVAGVDLNVVPVWENYRGEGVNIAIVDTGVNPEHPDLLDNLRMDLSLTDFQNGIYFPDSNGGLHGTNTAGVVAAVGDNGIGIAGVAYQASMIPVLTNMWGWVDHASNVDAAARALAHGTVVQDQANAVHVSNNSWGTRNTHRILAQPDAPRVAALERAIREGRDGRGVIFVFAAGNGRCLRSNVNYDWQAKSRYTIAVGASSPTGERAFYSEPGAAMLVNAPSRSGWPCAGEDGNNSLGIVTTDRVRDVAGGWSEFDRNYTATYDGTSAAAPQVAGVAALMLEANPNLGWRDVQYILLSTATQNNAAESWQQNGAGRWYSEEYGYGRVNALNAVNKAVTWPGLPPKAPPIQVTQVVNLEVPDGVMEPTSSVIDIVAPNHFVVEHVTVRPVILSPARGNTTISLVSPSGMVSRLALSSPANTADWRDWDLESVAHWGESASGPWRLDVVDIGGGLDSQFVEWTLTLHGHFKAVDGYPELIAPPAEFQHVARTNPVTGRVGPAYGAVVQKGNAIHGLWRPLGLDISTRANVFLPDLNPFDEVSSGLYNANGILLSAASSGIVTGHEIRLASAGLLIKRAIAEMDEGTPGVPMSFQYEEAPYSGSIPQLIPMAKGLDLSFSVEGAVEFAGNFDRRLIMPETSDGFLTLTVTPEPDLDVALDVFGADGALLATRDEEGTGVAETLTLEGLAPLATVYIRVRGSDTGTISLADTHRTGSFTLEGGVTLSPGMPAEVGVILSVDGFYRPNPVTGLDTIAPGGTLPVGEVRNIGAVPFGDVHTYSVGTQIADLTSLFTTGVYTVQGHRAVSTGAPASPASVVSNEPFRQFRVHRAMTWSSNAPGGNGPAIQLGYQETPTVAELEPVIALAPGEPFSTTRMISMPGQNDYYLFEAPQESNGTIVVNLKSEDGLNGRLDLFDSDGNHVRSANNQGPNGSENIQYDQQVVAGSIWYVMIRSAINSGALSNTAHYGSYQLTVTFPPQPTPTPTPSPIPDPCSELVEDGGFEVLVSSPWLLDTDSDDSILCAKPECRTISEPHGGEGYAILGSNAALVTNSVLDQKIVIPANQGVEVVFYVSQPFASGKITDMLSVSIGETIFIDIPADKERPDWEKYSFTLPAEADDRIEFLTFTAVTQGEGPSIWAIDDVSARACPAVVPTPTPTPTATPSPTPTPTLTPTPDVSPTATVAPSPTVSITPTATAEPTPSASPTPAPTDVPTPTGTVSPTPTDIPTATTTPTVSPTATAEPTPSASPTPAPTDVPTPTGTASPTPTDAPTATVTPTASPTATAEPTASPSPTPAPTDHPTPTGTVSPTPTDAPTATITPTASPTATAEPTASPSPTPAPGDSRLRDIRRILLGLETANLLLHDLNGDGVVDAGDLVSSLGNGSEE